MAKGIKEGVGKGTRRKRRGEGENLRTKESKWG